MWLCSLSSFSDFFLNSCFILTCLTICLFIWGFFKILSVENKSFYYSFWFVFLHSFFFIHIWAAIKYCHNLIILIIRIIVVTRQCVATVCVYTLQAALVFLHHYTTLRLIRAVTTSSRWRYIVTHHSLLFEKTHMQTVRDFHSLLIIQKF